MTSPGRLWLEAAVSVLTRSARLSFPPVLSCTRWSRPSQSSSRRECLSSRPSGQPVDVNRDDRAVRPLGHGLRITPRERIDRTTALAVIHHTASASVTPPPPQPAPCAL